MLETTRVEEEAFLATIEGGHGAVRAVGAVRAARGWATPMRGTISGEDAFRLYDTFGFPIDLTELMARERGYYGGHRRRSTPRSTSNARGRKEERKSRRLTVEVDELGDSAAWDAAPAVDRGRRVVRGLRRGGDRDAGHGVAPAGRRPRGGAAPGNAVLRRVGRAGVRPRGDRGPGVARRRGRRAQARRAAGRGGPPHRRVRVRTRHGPRALAAPPGHGAQPHGHASAARGAAPGAGRRRAPGGVAGGARPAALRFHPPRSGGGREAGRDRSAS